MGGRSDSALYSRVGTCAKVIIAYSYVGLSGGGGYGDPLDRDPEAVPRDVSGNLTSVHDARELYGFVFTEANGAVDAAATQARRSSIRAARTDALAAA